MRKEIKNEYPYKIDEMQFKIDFEKRISDVKEEYGYKFSHLVKIDSSKSDKTIIDASFTFFHQHEPIWNNNTLSMESKDIIQYQQIYEHVQSAIQNCAINNQMK